MYLRHSVRRKDGKTHTYWRLVQSVRRNGKVFQETVAQLGELDAEGRAKAKALARQITGRGEQRELFEANDADDGAVHGDRRFIDSSDILVHADAFGGGDRLYPRDAVLRDEVDGLEEGFDTKLGPHTRRWVYAQLLMQIGPLRSLWSRGVPKLEASLVPLMAPLVRPLIRARRSAAAIVVR